MTRRDLDAWIANYKSCTVSNGREFHTATANHNSSAISNAHELDALTAKHNCSAVSNAHKLHTLTCNSSAIHNHNMTASVACSLFNNESRCESIKVP